MKRRTGIRIFMLAAAVLAVFCCASAQAESGGEWGGISWSLSPGHILSISGTGPIPDFTRNSTDAWRAFLTSIERIEIGEGITGIGAYAFEGCSYLKGLTIPADVT